MCNSLCSVIVLCRMMMKGREKVIPVSAHSLLFSKSTKGAARPHPTDESLSTVLYAFSTYVLRKGLEFNPGL